MRSAVKKSGQRGIAVAICGNPNCGKTTIFNALTGLSQHVGNYPGVTVEKVVGQFSLSTHPDLRFNLIDIPGTYSLSAFTPDEYIAASALYGDIDGENPPDLIVSVIDAANLERSLYLLQQVLQTGCPVVVALNMVDIAEKRGTRIDAEKLSSALGGIPVVPVVGNKGRGLDRLKLALLAQAEDPRVPSPLTFDSTTEKTLQEVVDKIGEPEQIDGHEGGPHHHFEGHRQRHQHRDLRQGEGTGQRRRHCRAHYLRILFDEEGPAEKRFVARHGAEAARILKEGRGCIRAATGSLTTAEMAVLTEKAHEIAQQVISHGHGADRSHTDKLDRVLLHSIMGPLILVALMGVMFQSIFSWAEPFMGLIDGFFGWAAAQVESGMAEGPLRSLLTDGIIGGVGSVLIFIPQIVVLFVFIALMEDSGYMPRAAFLVDRMFRWCGLSGKSFIPMLSSFACAVPGIMATRTIEDRKLRMMTILLAPLMTCSARLPVYAIMISAFIPYQSYFGIINLQGVVLSLLYLLGLLVAVAVAFVLKKTIYKTEQGTFLMELPTYKLPTFRSVAVRVLNRVKAFVMRAGTVIMAITIIIWALSYYPHGGDAKSDFERRVTQAELNLQEQTDEIALQMENSISDLNARQRLALRGTSAAFADVTTPEHLTEVQRQLLEQFPEQAEYVNLQTSMVQLRLEHSRLLDSLSLSKSGYQIRNSYFGMMGRGVEPVFRPLGWDWKITMAVLASFPAREVIIAVLGTVYNLGAEVDEKSSSLIDKMRQATWEDGDKIGQPVFTPAVALSIMVFFALCCQCGATLVTIKQETARWSFAVITFVYMTSLAYILGFATFQIFSRVGL